MIFQNHDDLSNNSCEKEKKEDLKLVLKIKGSFFLLVIFCIVATGLGIYFLGGIEPARLQVWLQQMGIYAPIAYIFLYTLGTLLILPSTPLNLTGGAIFGVC